MRQWPLKLSGRQEAPHKPCHCRAWHHLCLCAVRQAVHGAPPLPAHLHIGRLQVCMTSFAGHTEPMQNATIVTEATGSTGSVGLAKAQCGRRRLTLSGATFNCSGEPTTSQRAGSGASRTRLLSRILAAKSAQHAAEAQNATMSNECTGCAGVSQTALVGARHG